MDFEQKEAIYHSSGPALVIAGPGCGKTSVITERIYNMVNVLNIDPKSIVALSFTRYSSSELKQRTIIKDSCLGSVFFGTIHSFFLSILKDYFSYPKDSVIGNEEKNNLIINIISNIISSNYIPNEALDIISSKISEIKNSNYDFDNRNAKINFENDFIKTIYIKYNSWLEDNNKLDFDDILSKTHHLVKSNPHILNLIRKRYMYFIIDEFQDINKVQFDTIRLFLSSDENLFVVGDEDQSIYGFRGASPVFMVNFTNYFKNAKIYPIIKSYRCPPEILNVANELISKNKSRTSKTIESGKNNQGFVRIIKYTDVIEQAKNIASEIKQSKSTSNMIISRTNFEILPFIKSMRDYNIKFKIKDKEFNFFSNFIFKDIMSYLKLSQNYSLDQINRIRNKPDRGLNYIHNENDFRCISVSKIKKTIKLNVLKNQISNLKNLSFINAVDYIRTTIGYDNYLISYSKKYDIDIEYLYDFFEVFYFLVDNETSIKDGINMLEKEYKSQILSSLNNSISSCDVLLVTAHASKGLEADNIFWVSVNEGQFPHIRANDIEEERRLAYVAISRAKKNLYISYLSMNKRKIAFPSEFLLDVQKCINKNIML